MQRLPREQMVKRIFWSLSSALAAVLTLVCVVAARPSMSATVVINEVQTGGSGDANREFIELYNNSISGLNLNGYRLIYRSAAGTNDNAVYTFQPTDTVPAHGYFLLVHSGQNVGVTPDASFAQSLSAAGGGLAISATDSIVDSVGWGTATNAFVETAAAPAPPADQSIARQPTGADTDNNASDFQVATIPSPQNSGGPGGGSIGFAITKAAPASVNIDQTFIYTLAATNHLSATALSVVITDALPLSVTIASVSDGGGRSGHVVSWTIGSLLDGETITRTVVVTAPSAATILINSDYGVWASNYLTRTPGNAVTTQVVGAGSACPAPVYTLRTISAVQGSGASSPFNAQNVTVRGTVIGQYTPTGFFVQDGGDGDPATSDGLFVNSTAAVNLGDAVQIDGTVSEANTLTQLTSTSVTVCGTPALVTPTLVTLPVPISTTLEPYEDMLVTFPQTLTVDQNFFQGRYGQVTLSGMGRMYNPTNGHGLGDTIEYNLRRMIVLDDGSSAQNPNPIPYLGADNTLRAGDTISNLIGVIDYGPINSDTAIQHYRLQPTAPVTFTRANPRPIDPPNVGAPPNGDGSIRVASFNVLNYFNGDGQGGGFPTPRGANTYAEFIRQRTKIITAVVTLNADVVGLMEIENDGDGALSAIQDLVNGLNAATAPNTFDFIRELAPGADQIRVAMIYRMGRITPIGSGQNYQTSTATYSPLFDRPPLYQRFQAAGGESFYVIVNHFKSKGSCPASGTDPDADYGQGCWNAKRVAQANGLLTLINTLSVTGTNVIVIGDLNAYGVEDPIVVLTNGGLIDQVAAHEPAPERYSYVFDGQSGYLDHALTTAGLDAQISGVRHWHINADEPSVIDYNTEFKPQDLYSPTPYRASDHDPVLIGLNLNAAPDFSGSSKSANATVITSGLPFTYTLVISNSGTAAATFALTDTLNANLTLIDAPGFSANGATLTVTGTLNAQTSQTLTITVRTTPIFSGTIGNTATLSGDGQVRTLIAPEVNVKPIYFIDLPLIQG